MYLVQFIDLALWTAIYVVMLEKFGFDCYDSDASSWEGERDKRAANASVKIDQPLM